MCYLQPHTQMSPKSSTNSRWQRGRGQVGSGSFSTFALAHWLRSVTPLLCTMQCFATNAHNNTPLSPPHTSTHRVNNADAPRWKRVIAACTLLSNPLSNYGVVCVADLFFRSLLSFPLSSPPLIHSNLVHSVIVFQPYHFQQGHI